MVITLPDTKYIITLYTLAIGLSIWWSIKFLK